MVRCVRFVSPGGRLCLYLLDLCLAQNLLHAGRQNLSATGHDLGRDPLEKKCDWDLWKHQSLGIHCHLFRCGTTGPSILMYSFVQSPSQVQ